ncbi:hypothetical protein QBC44DRAFT_394523 [Cladorrhinum sp. PSN332]|nr:hypothetical protein QBC44DRAFT_394523 [Cladorrhinum sp. PSN332]
MRVIEVTTFACGHQQREGPTHCTAYAGGLRLRSIIFSSQSDCGKASYKQVDARDRYCSEKCATAIRDQRKERLMENGRAFAARQQAERQRQADEEKNLKSRIPLPYETRLHSRLPPPPPPPPTTQRRGEPVNRRPPPRLADRPMLDQSARRDYAPLPSQRRPPPPPLPTNLDRNGKPVEAISRKDAKRVPHTKVGTGEDPRVRIQTRIPAPHHQGSAESIGCSRRQYRDSTGSSLHTIPMVYRSNSRSATSGLGRLDERPPPVPPKDDKYLPQARRRHNNVSAVPKPLFSSRPHPPPPPPPPPKAPSTSSKSSRSASGEKKGSFFRRLFGVRPSIKREESLEWVSEDARGVEKGKGRA